MDLSHLFKSKLWNLGQSIRVMSCCVLRYKNRFGGHYSWVHSLHLGEGTNETPSSEVHRYLVSRKLGAFVTILNFWSNVHLKIRSSIVRRQSGVAKKRFLQKGRGFNFQANFAATDRRSNLFSSGGREVLYGQMAQGKKMNIPEKWTSVSGE